MKLELFDWLISCAIYLNDCEAKTFIFIKCERKNKNFGVISLVQ